MNVTVTFTLPGTVPGFIISGEELSRWDVMLAPKPTAHSDWLAAWHCARKGVWDRLFNNPRYFATAKQMLEAR